METTGGFNDAGYELLSKIFKIAANQKDPNFSGPYISISKTLKQARRG